MFRWRYQTPRCRSLIARYIAPVEWGRPASNPILHDTMRNPRRENARSTQVSPIQWCGIPINICCEVESIAMTREFDMRRTTWYVANGRVRSYLTSDICMLTVPHGAMMNVFHRKLRIIVRIDRFLAAVTKRSGKAGSHEHLAKLLY
jgi:hypothetical protein